MRFGLAPPATGSALGGVSRLAQGQAKVGAADRPQGTLGHLSRLAIGEHREALGR